MHKFRPHRKKLAASLQSRDEIKHTTNSGREMRERELQEAWDRLFWFGGVWLFGF